MKQQNKHKGEQGDAALQEAQALQQRAETATQRHAQWQGLWRECYRYALPQRDAFTPNQSGNSRGMEQIYDATALDAVDQLAASLVAQLTPPWSEWFGFRPGPDVAPDMADKLSGKLEKVAQIIQNHFDRSNFAVEIHQCFLDLITGGTATLHFSEGNPGDASAFRFAAIPLNQTVLNETGSSGALNTLYRDYKLSVGELLQRFPKAAQVLSNEKDPARQINVLEACEPEGMSTRTTIMMRGEGDEAIILSQKSTAVSPYISFRWIKSPGEVYGRSPIMKALPDIKTANKVVELVLKNASIAVSGIWQADDDGVLNPSNIELLPGTIIPKAVGSRGLTPLDMPGRFDVSQLVLEDLRTRIRQALIIDRLGPAGGPSMTATEVLERSSEMVRLLGATYGRLQVELLTPLVTRAYNILRRRGEIPDLGLDGRDVQLDYRSPLARAQAQRNVRNVIDWLAQTQAMGPDAAQVIDFAASARWLGEALGVPSNLIRKENALDTITRAAQQGGMNGDDVEPDQLAALSQIVPGLGDLTSDMGVSSDVKNTDI